MKERSKFTSFQSRRRTSLERMPVKAPMARNNLTRSGSLAQNRRKLGRTENADVATAILGLGDIVRFGRLSFGEIPMFTRKMEERDNGAANVVSSPRSDVLRSKPVLDLRSGDEVDISLAPAQSVRLF